MKRIAVLVLVLLMAFTCALAEAPAGEGIPHGELNIKYPAIIDVNEEIFAQRPYKIAYANIDDQNSISIIVRDSVVDACKYYGIECMVFDNKLDPAQAIVNVDTAIQANVDYYLNFNQDVSVNAAIAEKLEAANIPLICIQMGAREGIDPEYHVNNERAGSICGELLVEAAMKEWPDEKPILFVVGLPEAGINFITRANSCIEAVKAAMPDVEVIETNSEGSPEITRQKTADFLTAHPTGKIMMWCHVDQNTMGMLAAVKAANRSDDVIITSFGANPVVFEELKDPDSPIIGSVAQFSERFGWDILPMVLKHLDEGISPELITLPPLDIITRENLAIYYPGS